jgi:hypothetical protein
MTAINGVSADYGDWTVVSSSTSLTGSSLNLTSLSKGNHLIKFKNWQPATTTVQLRMRGSTDNGSSYETSNYQYVIWTQDNSANLFFQNSNVASEIRLTNDGVEVEDPSTTQYGINGWVRLYDANVASRPMRVIFESVYHSGAGTHGVTRNYVSATTADDGAGGRTDEIDAVQFYWSSGNFTSGDYVH